MTTNEETEETTLSELMQEYFDQNKMYCFEGDRGLENLNTLCADLGYEESQFKFGSPLEQFLYDNSGAINAITDWIEEQNLSDWRDNIESRLIEKDEDE